jgi:hypothetical protein
MVREAGAIKVHPATVRPILCCGTNYRENVDKGVGGEDATYVCRQTVPMLTARPLFLSLPSTNIASLFYLTTTFASLDRLVFLISLDESADRPPTRAAVYVK